MSICTGCGEECGEMQCDDGIGHYEYWGSRGYDSRPYVGSDCCEAPIAEDGGVVVDQVTVHVARKDHVNANGRVVVRAGHKYRRRYFRSWYIDKNGYRQGHVRIEKREVSA